ncbi:MAG: hypothetical protein COA50_11565 [Flavobacteriaceae bacterium]|nr:MAG: hypothetical protein COA50_11565 [Flavobacteriaceae bacterium]
MSNINKKIKAFTLNEMLVVLLMTTIVVGMAFAVLNLVQQQMHGIESNYERNTSHDLLRQSLWIDFNQFDGIWYDAKEEELLFVNELKEVKYKLYDDMVVKDLDTFFIAWKKRNFYFKANTQSSGEVDALDFVTSKENGTRRMFVFKRNAATTYMN